ncbi:hypothetical protein BC941DRAFT_507684 [Chlamydoabsidia padenii]|nr:hypothetical protein BC941DRAFT_507684 [Chlamydoabsidia padenii]
MFTRRSFILIANTSVIGGPKKISRRLTMSSFHDSRRLYTTNSSSRHSQVVAQLDSVFYEDHKPIVRNANASKAEVIFQKVWSNIEQHYGIQHVRLPSEIIFLMGAPGAGKGTHTPSILQARGIQNQPIGVSHLLQSPECKTIMDQGLLIPDSHVIELMLHAILRSPFPGTGVLVDGFPRTEIQAQVLRLFYDKWFELHARYNDCYPRPNVRICVLYVDEETSVDRQMARGEQIRRHNQQVKLTGQGEVWQERATDSDELLMRERYRIFQSNYDSLLRLATSFPFHWIDASASPQQVLGSILKELDHHETQSDNLMKAIQYIDLHIIPHLRLEQLSIPIM